jgi:hypothetical protein
LVERYISPHWCIWSLSRKLRARIVKLGC